MIIGLHFFKVDIFFILLSTAIMTIRLGHFGYLTRILMTVTIVRRAGLGGEKDLNFGSSACLYSTVLATMDFGGCLSLPFFLAVSAPSIHTSGRRFLIFWKHYQDY